MTIKFRDKSCFSLSIRFDLSTEALEFAAARLIKEKADDFSIDDITKKQVENRLRIHLWSNGDDFDLSFLENRKLDEYELLSRGRRVCEKLWPECY